MSFTYLLLSLVGIVSNIILAITLIKLGPMPKQNAFVLLAKQILISDFCQLIAQPVVGFPLSFYGKNIYQGSWTIWIYNAVNFLDTVGYNGVLDFTFVMAMNRLTVFLVPQVHAFLFERTRTIKTILFVWCFLLTQITVANVMRCHKQFNYEEFYFHFVCNDDKASHVAIWLGFMRYQSYTFPVLMFISYMIIFAVVKTRLSHAQVNTSVGRRQRKYEINLVVQAATIAFFLELQTLSFTVLPMIGTGNDRFYSSLAQNIISILNNSANPFVYFFFNRQIRAGMLALLLCRKPKTFTTTVTVTEGIRSGF
ncbi:hypothetical protein Q1695_003930 [Nippostrongylus brasiliensis]|nr:hypothetical protein Q1695_003930 [Nippostrongylus brasiliensis]